MSNENDAIALRPFLIRALHEWMETNSWTAHLIVDLSDDEVIAPGGMPTEDDSVQYNISSSAVKDLLLGNDWVSFNARFSGVPQQITIPVRAILGVMARENGQGMLFNDQISDDETPGPDNGGSDGTAKDSGSVRPALKIVK
ncbi:Stringent starvation protein B [hydrothermal vent metagenome]|uniref:Stringent starvation protein B n=1 Tax=hydrothermal vent metagenome TaxID=652676 RepID=A0A3B0YV83_9ZZZZ